MKQYLLLAVSAIIAGAASSAFAQTAPALATVVATCGTPPNTYTAGQQRPMTQNTSGQECTAAAIGTVTAVTTVGTITNPVGVKGADGTAITSAANPLNVVQSPTAIQGLTPGQIGAAATNLVLKAGAGNLVNASATIGATSGYLLIFDATALPSDGAVTPDVCLPVTSNGTNGANSLSYPLPGKFFATGITLGFSTTGCFTLTAASASFLNGDVK